MMPVDEIKKLFSINLRKIMLENGKTQSDIVKDLNFRQSTVSDWLNGKKYPRMDKIEMLAQYFRISIDELISVSKQEKVSLSSLEEVLIMGIGKDLNELLEQKNIRVADLSRLANIPASTIYSILRRDNLKIEIDVLFKLCDVLNVAPEYFYNKQRAGNSLRLTSEEVEIIKKIRQLNADGKKYVLKSIKFALSDSEKSFEEDESDCI